MRGAFVHRIKSCAIFSVAGWLSKRTNVRMHLHFAYQDEIECSSLYLTQRSTIQAGYKLEIRSECTNENVTGRHSCIFKFGEVFFSDTLPYHLSMNSPTTDYFEAERQNIHFLLYIVNLHVGIQMVHRNISADNSPSCFKVPSPLDF